MSLHTKKYCIVTASDSTYGDFLIDHWFSSLRSTNDMEKIEPVILDYGLSTAQRFYLEENGALVRKCERDGHVVNIRFRDLALFLEEAERCEQVILSDSGDIIFQDDILPVFETAPGQLRGVTEDLKSGFSVFLNEEFFSKEDKKEIEHTLLGKPMVNAGFFGGPSDMVHDLARTVEQKLISKEKFGPDQLVVNYVFYSRGFHNLDRIYNFVVATAEADFTVKNGRFFSENRLIPVVHNTGSISFLRPVENFGFGVEKNQVKDDLLRALRGVHTTSDAFYEIRDNLLLRFGDFMKDVRHLYDTSQENVDDLFHKFIDRVSRQNEED